MEPQGGIATHPALSPPTAPAPEFLGVVANGLESVGSLRGAPAVFDCTNVVAGVGSGTGTTAGGVGSTAFVVRTALVELDLLIVVGLGNFETRLPAPLSTLSISLAGIARPAVWHPSSTLDRNCASTSRRESLQW